MKKNLSLIVALFALMASTCLGATPKKVAFDLIDLTGTNFVPKSVRVTPGGAMSWGDQTIVGIPVRFTPTNSVFTNAITPGKYAVDFGPPYDAIPIVVPPDGPELYTFNRCAELASGLVQVTWTNAHPGHVQVNLQSGVVTAPTNFWSANSNSIATLIPTKFLTNDVTSATLGLVTLSNRQVSAHGARLGFNVTNTGSYSTAFGLESAALGEEALAGGYRAKATDNNAIAFGYEVSATNDAAIAFGYQSTAGGELSFVLGDNCFATGFGSMGLGAAAHATNDYSFVWSGDANYSSFGSTTSQQFSVFAPNGIRLLGGPIVGDGSGLTNVTTGLAEGGVLPSMEASNLTVNLAPLKPQDLIFPESLVQLWGRINTGKLRWVCIGDSIGGYAQAGSEQLLVNMMGLNGSGLNAGAYLLENSGGSPVTTTTDTSPWWQGGHLLASGDSILLRYNDYNTGAAGQEFFRQETTSIRADTAFVGYIQTNAGSLKLYGSANNGPFFNFATLSTTGTNGNFGYNVVLMPSNSLWRLKIEGNSANKVEVVSAFMYATNAYWNTSNTLGYIPMSLAMGGQPYTKLAAVSTNVFEPYIGALNPDLITFNGRHDVIPFSVLQRITNTCTNALIVLTTGHIANKPEDMAHVINLRSNNIASAKRLRDAGAKIMVVDTLPYLNNYKELARLNYYINDNAPGEVHMNTYGAMMMAQIFWNAMGLGNAQFNAYHTFSEVKGPNTRLFNTQYFPQQEKNVGIGTSKPRGRFDVKGNNGGYTFDLILTMPGEEAGYRPGLYAMKGFTDAEAPIQLPNYTNALITTDGVNTRVGKTAGGAISFGDGLREIASFTPKGAFLVGDSAFGSVSEASDLDANYIAASYAFMSSLGNDQYPSYSFYGDRDTGFFCIRDKAVGLTLNGRNSGGSPLAYYWGATGYTNPVTVYAPSFSGGTLAVTNSIVSTGSTNYLGGHTTVQSNLYAGGVLYGNGSGLTNLSITLWAGALTNNAASATFGNITASTNFYGSGYGLTNIPADRYAMRRQTVIREDFGYNDGKWLLLTGGSGVNHNFNTSFNTNGFGGFWNTTGGNANGYVTIALYGGHYFGYTEVWNDTKVALFDAATLAEPYTYTEGWIGDAYNPTASQEGMYWQYMGTNWLCITKGRLAGTNVTDSGVAPTLGFGSAVQKKSILYSVTGTPKVYFYINDVCVATNNPNQHPAYPCNWTFDCRKTGGSAGRTYLPDYFYTVITYPGGR